MFVFHKVQIYEPKSCCYQICRISKQNIKSTLRIYQLWPFCLGLIWSDLMLSLIQFQLICLLTMQNLQWHNSCGGEGYWGYLNSKVSVIIYISYIFVAWYWISSLNSSDDWHIMEKSLELPLATLVVFRPVFKFQVHHLSNLSGQLVCMTRA